MGELVALQQKVTAITGKTAVIRYQWDNAGPHTEESLKTYLEIEFASRGWLFVPQPPNSPCTNVQDCSVFPSMAKRVNRLQSLRHNGQGLRINELDEAVREIWNTYEMDTLGRTYLHHWQIVNAICQYGGTDGFVCEKGGLDCGIRRRTVPYYDGESDNEPAGVEVLETYEGVSINEKKFKYNNPQLEDIPEPLPYLSVDEIDFLAQHMSRDDPWFDRFSAIAAEPIFGGDVHEMAIL